jgi:hypothetical protein
MMANDAVPLARPRHFDHLSVFEFKVPVAILGAMTPFVELVCG